MVQGLILIACKAFSEHKIESKTYYIYMFHGKSIKCHAQNVFTLDLSSCFASSVKCDILNLEHGLVFAISALVDCYVSRTLSVKLTSQPILYVYLNFWKEK